MGDLTIAVQSAELVQKRSLLQKTKDSLSTESLIPTLQFGSNSASKNSKGNSVVSMETLNSELDAVTEKLAALIEATSVYLEKVANTFEELDRNLL